MAVDRHFGLIPLEAADEPPRALIRSRSTTRRAQNRIAADLQRAGGDLVADARIVLGGVASFPQPVPAAAKALKGTKLDDEAIAGAAQAAFKPAKPMDNTDFKLSWRKQMTRVYVGRALRELRERRS